MVDRGINHPAKNTTMVEPFVGLAAWLHGIHLNPTPGNLFAMGWQRVGQESFIQFCRQAKKIIS
jgi:hypothetical protein